VLIAVLSRACDKLYGGHREETSPVPGPQLAALESLVAPHATAEGSALSRFRSTAKKVVNARKVTAGLYADAQKRAQTRAKTATEAVMHRAASVTKLRGELQRRSSISSVKSATRRKYQATHGRRTAHHEAAIAPAARRATETPLTLLMRQKKLNRRAVNKKKKKRGKRKKRKNKSSLRRHRQHIRRSRGTTRIIGHGQ